MTTLKDISRRSGFSVTTVSRALNGFGDVTSATRGAIEAIARELNYRPNQVARKLATGRSGMVGLVLPAQPQPFEHGHFFEIVGGLSEAFSARDLDFVLHISAGGDPLGAYDRLISRGALDGFVVTFPLRRDVRIERLIAREVAFVVHGHEAGDDRYAFFDLDNHAVAVAAVDLLAAMGHRRIAVLNGPADWPSVAARLRGYRDALVRHGIGFDARLAQNGDTSPAYGAAATAALLSDAAARPTAVIACNSLTAVGVYAAARDAGLSIPTDLSVVAHDDALPQAPTDRFEPPLTVTWGPLRDAAEPLAELIVRRIEGAPVAELQVTRAPTLIVRASAAAPRSRGRPC